MGKTLAITDPLTLGPEQLVGANVPEDEYPPWSATATYALAARVIHKHEVYESAQANNLGNDPATASEAFWLHVGPTNRWRAFDLRHVTATQQAGGFWYEFKPGFAINAIHVAGMADCNTIRFQLIDPTAGVVWDTGALAVGRVITQASWWQWCFGRRVDVTRINWDAIPIYPQAKLRIDVTGGDACAIDSIIAGQVTTFGVGVKSGLRISIDDYSTKERDKWGQARLELGQYSDRLSLELVLDNNQIDQLHDFLVKRRASVLFFNMSSRWQATQVLAFYKSWEIGISYPTYSDVSIELEGMELK